MFKRQDHYFILDYEACVRGAGTYFIYEFYFENDWHVKIEEVIPAGF